MFEIPQTPIIRKCYLKVRKTSVNTPAKFSQLANTESQVLLPGLLNHADVICTQYINVAFGIYIPENCQGPAKSTWLSELVRWVHLTGML